MSIYNVDYNGKFACFSSISENFITHFMNKEDFKEWLKKEYHLENPSLDERKIDLKDAIFYISLNRTFEESLINFKKCGLDETFCEKLFLEMLEKNYKPIYLKGKKCKCPNCGTIIEENTKECPDHTCCMKFYWSQKNFI